MRKSARKKSVVAAGRGLKVAIYFVVLVIGIIVFSYLLRIVGVARQSSFGTHRFNIEIINSSPKIISLSKADSEIQVVNFENGVQIDDLEIPIDTRIESGEDISYENLKKDLPSIILRGDLTIFDKFGIISFLLRIKDSSISQVDGRSLDESGAQEIFADKIISQEKKTIQIINSSGVAGLGNKLAKLITVEGGDVILVTTGDKVVDSSSISFKNKSETTSWLRRYLNFPTKESRGDSLADVIIELGKDVGDSTNF